MSILVELAPIEPLLAGLSPEERARIERLGGDAVRRLGPSVWRDCLDGAATLTRLGKGGGVALAFLEAMPPLARDMGDEIVDTSLRAALRLASMTSGEVLARVFETLPVAAARLGDAALLDLYFDELHRLATLAPWGLRPMLGCLERLLSVLTLGGLRRWAEFGAQAHRGHPARLKAYFSLDSEDSLAVLQRERRGTLLVDVQRRLGYDLRAFWGRDYHLRPVPLDTMGARPFLAEATMHLPDAVEERSDVTGAEIYRAIAFHMAAHLEFGAPFPECGGLDPREKLLVGLIEDARVESLAIRAFPGLRRLWRSLMPVAETAAPVTMPEGCRLLEHLVLALLDGAPGGEIPLLAPVVARFLDRMEREETTPALSLDLGRDLYAALAGRALLPGLRALETLRLGYRDDNRVLWDADAAAFARDRSARRRRPERRHVSLMEFVNETEVETAGDDADEIWVPATELYPYEDDGISFQQRARGAPRPCLYPEWDDRLQTERPDWVTVWDVPAARGEAGAIDGLIAANTEARRRLRGMVERLRPKGLIRRRGLEDGDDLDINAAVEAVTRMRLGLSPDPRITQRQMIDQRTLSVLILLDLSASTNDPVAGTGRSLLDLTREACALLAHAIAGIGDPFAIHGFHSNGREDVRYYQIKSFSMPFGRDAKERLAGLSAGLSTRMGAAIRHATTHFLPRPERRKLLLVVTDGEPADIDERDPRHLRQDARKAVEAARRVGLQTHCLTLDPQADRYVNAIFGVRGYTVLDRPERLPEALSRLFAALTGGSSRP